jgi:ABC-type proline/glycine betaine transport system permease subunit
LIAVATNSTVLPRQTLVELVEMVMDGLTMVPVQVWEKAGPNTMNKAERIWIFRGNTNLPEIFIALPSSAILVHKT